MIIIVDMDEVLCETHRCWLSQYNSITKEGVGPDSVTHYKVARFVKQPKILYELMNSYCFFANLPPVSGAKKALKTLVEKGHNVIIATSVCHEFVHTETGKRQWIKKHLPWFHQDNLIFIRHKYLLRGDLLIDDRIENIATFPGRTLIFDRPHNREYNASCRVKNWGEILLHVEELKNSISKSPRTYEQFALLKGEEWDVSKYM